MCFQIAHKRNFHRMGKLDRIEEKLHKKNSNTRCWTELYLQNKNAKDSRIAIETDINVKHIYHIKFSLQE